MSYIKKRATKFAEGIIDDRSVNHNEVVLRTQEELFKIVDEADKVNFVSTVLERNQEQFQVHLVNCSNLDNCPVNYEYESVNYYLTQELKKLGVRTYEDQFTTDEKRLLESALDSIKIDLQTVKNGQEIIYNEIESLKELFILGKKNWIQLFVGKFTEMTVSGIVSETASKQFIDFIKNVDLSQISIGM
jgi:hypothetical protein